MQANTERGEVELTLKDGTFVLRPSFEAITHIEELTGRTLVELAVAVGRGAFGGLPLRDMAFIVTEGIRAAGKDRDDKLSQSYKVEKIGEMIYDHGVVNSMPSIEKFLRNALNGGTTPKKTAVDEETTESTTVD